MAMQLVTAKQALYVFENSFELEAFVPDEPGPPQSLISWLQVVRPVSCVADSSKCQIRVKSRQAGCRDEQVRAKAPGAFARLSSAAAARRY